MTDTFKPAALQTARLIGAIAALNFRPMNNNDFAAFADAEPGSLIAFGGAELAELLCDVTGETVMTEGDDPVVVIVSGAHVEVSGMTADYNPVGVALDLAPVG